MSSTDHRRITLLNPLSWNPSRPFDLGNEKCLRSTLGIVIRERSRTDDLNHGLLIEHWATLGLLRYIAA